MKRPPGLLLLLLLLLGCATAERAQTPHLRLVILSIDGLRPEFYLDEKWEAPTLRALAARGARARGMTPIFPTVTYPNHTTAVTGVRSARHGVFANTVFSMTAGPTAAWYWDSNAIRVPTLWKLAKDAGYTTAIVGWPVSGGALVDWLVPEIFPVHGVNDILGGQKMSPYEMTRLGTTAMLRARLDRELPETDFMDFAARDRWLAQAAEVVLRENKPEFMLIHLGYVDWAQHETGRGSALTHSAIKATDASLARLLEAAGPDATFIVLGDHGFLDFDRYLHLNALLGKHGWLHASEGRLKDWKAVAHSAGGDAAIYVKAESDAPAVIADLKKHAHGLYRVITRAELDALEAYPGAACALEPVAGVSFGPHYDGPVVEKSGRTRGQHGYHPSLEEMRTGFIASGPGIATRELGNIDMVDVAPTAAALMGVELKGAEGQAIPLKNGLK